MKKGKMRKRILYVPESDYIDLSNAALDWLLTGIMVFGGVGFVIAALAR
jgi:hypothetical protein